MVDQGKLIRAADALTRPIDIKAEEALAMELHLESQLETYRWSIGETSFPYTNAKKDRNYKLLRLCYLSISDETAAKAAVRTLSAEVYEYYIDALDLITAVMFRAAGFKIDTSLNAFITSALSIKKWRLDAPSDNK